MAGGRHLPVARAFTQRAETALQLERAAKPELCQLLDVPVGVAAFLPERGERVLVRRRSSEDLVELAGDVGAVAFQFRAQ
ncbi:hypothetical protein D3C83_20610 [compost metagenome]